MLTNSLNTNTVVMSTANIIQTKQDLLTSKYSVCWLRDETEYHLTEHAPKGSYLHNVFEKSLIYDPATRSRRVCIASKDAAGGLDLV